MYIGEKITTEVTLIGDYEFENYFVPWNPTTNHIYTMKDSKGNIFVWKTASCMNAKTGTRINHWGEKEDVITYIQKGDRIQITGTVKDHSIYKDEEQTVLQRVKIKLLEHCLTKEEKAELKAKEQLASIEEGDFIWTMPYKQFKEHYSDCETIAGSFNDHAEDMERTGQRFPATIDVIIRKGRLKNSGVRGEHFFGYQMTNEEGKWITYRAVCEENALKRVQKDFPEHSWTCTKVYDYRH